MKNLSSNDKKCVYGIILSCVIMVFGILFLVNAMGVANFYKSYAAIKNPLAKYLVVILVMATGIMLFSNVALRFEDDKLRKRLTIFITAFAFILTIPLTYVLIAMLPFHAKYNMADVENAIDARALLIPSTRPLRSTRRREKRWDFRASATLWAYIPFTKALKCGSRTARLSGWYSCLWQSLASYS